MADVEFFFDPVCPFAWITSRFTVEVAAQRDLDIAWRFICLRMVNEAKDYGKEFPPEYVRGHEAGRRMLRIAAAARDLEGNDAVGRLYTELGVRLHNDGRSRTEIRQGDDSLIGEAVSAAGLPPTMVDAADDERLDTTLRAETDEALARTGPAVGTPILTFGPGTSREASFFGPVLSRVPRGEEALGVWDAVELLARTPGMAELKRTRRDALDFR